MTPLMQNGVDLLIPDRIADLRSAADQVRGPRRSLSNVLGRRRHPAGESGGHAASHLLGHAR